MLVVVRHVAEHPPRLEVIMRPQEEGFAADALRVAGRDFCRLLGLDALQQSERRVRANDPLVDRRPLLVEIIGGLSGRPIVELDLRGAGLIARLGALVRVIAGDVAERPVARGASPRADRIGAVEHSVGGNQGGFHARFAQQRFLLNRAL